MTWLAQAPADKARTLRWLPILVAAATLVTATPFAWDKGFGTSLFLLFVYLPAATWVCIGLCVWAAIERKSTRARWIVISLLLIPAVIGGTFRVLPQIKDELRFLVWSHTHDDELREFADRDAIILDWESWGWAGSENDSYLVSNPNDDLAESEATAEWLRHVGSSCEIVALKRLRRGIYIVTTYECPLR